MRHATGRRQPIVDPAQEQIKDAEETGRSLGVQIRILNARNDADFDPALAALAGVRDAALLVSADPPIPDKLTGLADEGDRMTVICCAA